jgi:hypothetical protein
MKLSNAMTLPILPGALRLEVRNGASFSQCTSNCMFGTLLAAA